MTTKFTVKLVRPVFEAVVVEVLAESREAAALAAVDEVMNADTAVWVEVSEESDYRCHPVTVVESDVLEDVEELLYEDRYKYLLLQADTHEAEGEVLMQPWAVTEDALVFADVAQDWSGEVESMYRRGVENWMADLKEQINPTDTSAISRALIAWSMRPGRSDSEQPE